MVIWDEADEGSKSPGCWANRSRPLAAALERFAASLDAAGTETRRVRLPACHSHEPALEAQAALSGPVWCAHRQCSCREVAPALPAFTEQAAGRAAAGLMSAAMTEWSRRGRRVKLARLVAEAVAVIRPSSMPDWNCTEMTMTDTGHPGRCKVHRAPCNGCSVKPALAESLKQRCGPAPPVASIVSCR